MAKSSYVCGLCHEAVPAVDAILYEEKHYHVECANLVKSKNELLCYISHLFKFKREKMVGPKILSQIRSYIEKNNYSYTGILNSLKYFYEIKKGDVKKSNEGIGIVPYVYEEAQEYFGKLERKQERIAESIAKELNKEVEEIKIIKSKSDSKKKRIFDFEEE